MTINEWKDINDEAGNYGYLICSNCDDLIIEDEEYFYINKKVFCNDCITQSIVEMTKEIYEDEEIINCDFCGKDLKNEDYFIETDNLAVCEYCVDEERRTI